MKKCNSLQRKSKKVKSKRNRYKEMSEGVKAFAVNEASLMDDAKKISSELNLVNEKRAACISTTKCDASHLKKEFQMTKSKPKAAFEELINIGNEITPLRDKLRNNETELPIAKSNHLGATVHKAMLAKGAMPVGENKLLGIIRSFHPE